MQDIPNHGACIPKQNHTCTHTHPITPVSKACRGAQVGGKSINARPPRGHPCFSCCCVSLCAHAHTHECDTHGLLPPVCYTVAFRTGCTTLSLAFRAACMLHTWWPRYNRQHSLCCLLLQSLDKGRQQLSAVPRAPASCAAPAHNSDSPCRHQTTVQCEAWQQQPSTPDKGALTPHTAHDPLHTKTTQHDRKPQHTRTTTCCMTGRAGYTERCTPHTQTHNKPYSWPLPLPPLPVHQL